MVGFFIGLNMYTLEEWNEVLSYPASDLREFLINNDIDETGIPEGFDWDLFYECLVEDNPFKAGTGAWVDIFKNWYRHDKPETYGISRIAAGCTNADSDISFFTSTALREGLWRPEDFQLFLNSKIVNVSAKTNGKLTPSKRFLNSAALSRYLWHDNFVKLVDEKTLVNACCGDAKFILAFELVRDACKTRFKEFSAETLDQCITRTRLAAMFDDYRLGCNQRSFKSFKAAGGVKRFKALINAAAIGYIFDEVDAAFVIEIAKNAGPATIRLATRKILNNSINGVIPGNVFLEMITSLNNNDDILSFKQPYKKELLRKAIIEHYYPSIEKDEATEAMVTRVFELYGFQKGVLELFGDVTHEAIDTAVNVHFSNISAAANVVPTIDFAPQNF